MAAAIPAAIEQSAPDVQPLADSRFHGLKAQIETVIDGAIGHDSAHQPRLAQAMRYAVLGGGKRFRSLLTLAVGEVVDAPVERTLRVAAAIECVHAQTLVHDDLPCMDDDDLRRGRPSLHREFDEATAVLAGDALLALAFEILADPATHPDGEVRARLILALARTLGQDGLAGGQMMDLYPPENPSSQHTSACQARKTGALIRYAVEAATMLGSSTSDVAGHLIRFAGSLGLLFQVRDDLLDAVGNPAVVGKGLRKDLQRGRQSATALLGVEGAVGQANKLQDACRTALVPLGSKAAALLDLARFAIARMH